MSNNDFDLLVISDAEQPYINIVGGYDVIKKQVPANNGLEQKYTEQQIRLVSNNTKKQLMLKVDTRKTNALSTRKKYRLSSAYDVINDLYPVELEQPQNFNKGEQYIFTYPLRPIGKHYKDYYRLSIKDNSTAVIERIKEL